MLISQVNITRDEYDRQRQLDRDQDNREVSEYHQFSADSDDIDDNAEQLETVILNHGELI